MTFRKTEPIPTSHSAIAGRLSIETFQEAGIFMIRLSSFEKEKKKRQAIPQMEFVMYQRMNVHLA